MTMCFFLISKIKIPCINLIHHIPDLIAAAVGNDDIRDFFEFTKVMDDAGMEEGLIFQCGFVDYDFHALCFDPFHDALDGGLAVIVGVGLHREAVDTYDFRISFEDLLGDEVLPGPVGLHNCTHDVVGHVLVVGKELFRIFWEAVTAVAERRIIIKIADSRIQAHTFDDLAAA